MELCKEAQKHVNDNLDKWHKGFINELAKRKIVTADEFYLLLEFIKYIEEKNRG